jgi:hypothetical protein
VRVVGVDVWTWIVAMLKSWELWVGGLLTLAFEAFDKMLGYKLPKRGYL